MKKPSILLLVVAMPVMAADPARDTHERLNAILWVQTSAEYKTLAAQTYRQAWTQIEDKLSKASAGYGIPSAAIEQVGFNTGQLPYAVILDIDETVLDNSPMSGRLIESRAGYTPENWSKWVDKEAADFLPGAESFINKAREAKIEIIFITNRTEEEEIHTMADLRPLVVGDDQILASAEEESPGHPWPSEKSSRRAFIAKRFWIIGMVGDDLADFIPNIKVMPHDERVIEARKYQERFGDQWFLLPNPVYGSWEAVLYDRKDPDKKQLEDKIKNVKSFQPDP